MTASGALRGPWIRTHNAPRSDHRRPPVPLMEFIGAIETALGQEAQKNFMEMQPGDVPATWADGTLLSNLTGYAPKTSVQDGVAQFVEWYREYYQV